MEAKILKQFGDKSRKNLRAYRVKLLTVNKEKASSVMLWLLLGMLIKILFSQ